MTGTSTSYDINEGEYQEWSRNNVPRYGGPEAYEWLKDNYESVKGTPQEGFFVRKATELLNFDKYDDFKDYDFGDISNNQLLKDSKISAITGGEESRYIGKPIEVPEVNVTGTKSKDTWIQRAADHAKGYFKQLRDTDLQPVVTGEEAVKAAAVQKKMEPMKFTPTDTQLLDDFSIKTKPLNQRSMIGNATQNIGGAGGYKVYGS
tara:strand:+ start:1863 stop:2477 length:615 start_codon:yes stop_codon:yes gene_type:complete